MRKTLNIPATVDEVIADLADDAALHTATGWRLAARLAAIVRLQDGPGRPENAKNRNYKTTVDIAALGIRGLTNHETVQRYVKGWLDAHKGIYPEPGETVAIPEGQFPPEQKNVGTRTPKTTTLAVEQLIERDGIEAVIEAIPDELLNQVVNILNRILHVEGGVREPREPSSLDDRWVNWLTKQNTQMVTGARLADESEAPGVKLGVHAAAGLMIYESLVERRIDAELRGILAEAG